MRFDAGEVNIPKDGATGSEDTVLNRPDLGLFGVFDGMGGPGDGDVASGVAKEAVERFYARETGQNRVKTLHQAGHTAREALMEAQEALQQRAADEPDLSPNMGSTATIGCVFQGEDDICLAYAHVGDSGMLIVRHYDGHLKFVTEEEAEQNVLHNVLSARGQTMHGVRQYGVVALDPGDRLVFYSDGISGDTDEQRLSEAEWREAVTLDDSQTAATRLAETSRKTDDKAALVIDVSPDEGSRETG